MVDKKDKKEWVNLKVSPELRKQLKMVSLEEEMYLRDVTEKFLKLGLKAYKENKKE